MGLSDIIIIKWYQLILMTLKALQRLFLSKFCFQHLSCQMDPIEARIYIPPKMTCEPKSPPPLPTLEALPKIIRANSQNRTIEFEGEKACKCFR